MILQIDRLKKTHGGLRPLRIASLAVGPAEHVSISGLDASTAEVFVSLVTGAALPDEGEIRIRGRYTAAIADETEWLASLDQFGIVSHRAVLLDGSTVQQNLALPFTLELDPIPEDIVARVADLALDVELGGALLSSPAGGLQPSLKMRIQLGRALAIDPILLLLEHPTASFEPEAGAAFGRLVARLAERRGLAVLALTEDKPFARALGGRQLCLNGATGALTSKWSFF